MNPDKVTDAGFGRRLFLKAAGLMGLLVSLPRTVRAEVKKRLPIRTVESVEMRFDPGTGEIRYEGDRRESYSLKIDGLVEKPLDLSYADLRALPQTGLTADFHCVEGWSIHDVKWSGFRFEELLKRVKLQADARYVVFHSLGLFTGHPYGLDHYVESFPLDRLTDSKAEILMALDMDGEPLEYDHGAPLRVLSPFDLAYKSIKFVTRVEFTRNAEPGWWSVANPIYPIDAPVPAERLRKKP